MAVPKKLTYVFIIFYIGVIIYLLLLFFLPPFQAAIINLRNNIGGLTAGNNYFWALFISFWICFIGSASIAFPIPFPFVLFGLSLSVIDNYGTIQQAIQVSPFWFQIFGIAIIGGLGCAFGELSGYIVGYGAKKLANGTHSELLENVDGFGKLILENERRAPLYVFIFALTPLPDDIIFLPLGMIKYPAWKCILPGWLGKTVTTLAYCLWPVLFKLGILGSYSLGEDITSIMTEMVTEAIFLIITITVMFFIMSFDWNKYLDNRKNKKM